MSEDRPRAPRAGAPEASARTTTPLPDLSAQTPEADALPMQLGRYRLEAFLGEGGMGRVYRAPLEGPAGFRKPVALKLIKVLDGRARDFSRQAFDREARVGGLLHHRNVVEVYDFGLHEGHPFLVMELVKGISLDALLRERGTPPPRAGLEVAIQIARGLQHAHELEDDGTPLALVHRDLKPGNVLVTPRGRVKVMDFGLARTMRAQDRVTKAGVLRGTPAYMSPEQAKGTEALDPRSDLFSFGVLLYELVTGHHPWNRPNLLAQVLALQEVETITSTPGFWDEPNAKLPEIDQVIGRCLRTDPADRFHDTGELVAALSSFLAEASPGPRLRAWVSPAPEAEPPPKPPKAAPDSSGLSPTEPERSVPRTPPAAKHNLPPDLDTFIGRKEALADLTRRTTQGERLITLVGAGGTGKTRLCLRFGAEQYKYFPGGAWFCDLTEARTREGILSAVAKALDVALTQQDPEIQLANAIRGRRRVLILLDNFEQVIDQAAETVGHWLEHAPEAVFLVTSRALLRIQGETALYVDPLSVPEAMQLFYDRAYAVQPVFARTEANAPVIQEIVERLDCMSLAIELAAARMRLMPPEQILARLSRRFQLLQGKRRDQSARQATLRGAIDWSWKLLAPDEQATLLQLSVFRGGCTLEAAEAVVDLSAFDHEPWVMDTVEALVDMSLLRREEPREGYVRFRMFESIQAYAAEKLGNERTGALLRHATHFATFDQKESLYSHGSVEQRRRRALDLDNLIAGVESALAVGEPELAAHCGLAAFPVLRSNGPVATGAAIFETLSAQPLAHPSRAIVRSYEMYFAMVAGRPSDALLHGEHSLAMYRKAGDRRGEGRILANLGSLHVSLGHMADAVKYVEESLAIHQEVDDRVSENIAHGNLGILNRERGHPTQALANFEAALALSREMGNLLSEGMDLNRLGIFHMDHGRLEEASKHYEQAIVVSRKVGSRRGEGIVLGNFGILRMNQGRLEEATTHYEQAITIHREVGNLLDEALVVGQLATLLYYTGDFPVAEGHLQRAIEILDRIRPAAAGDCRGTLALIRADGGDLEAARALLQEGDAQLRGKSRRELAKLLSKRARVELLAGERAAASAALAEAEAIVEKLQVAGDSEVGQEISRAREALTSPSA